MNCKCANREYCHLGFNMMAYSDPCKAGLTEIPVETEISQGGELVAPPETQAQKKTTIPWWLIIIGGYLLYSKGQGI